MNSPAASSYEDWFRIFGVKAPYDLIIDVFNEAIGEKKLKNGETSRSGYKLGKGTKFTTYFINLLKLRANGDGKKEPIIDNGGKDPIPEPAPKDKTQFVDVSELAIVNMAEFFSEILKSGKALSMSRGIYSLHLVNYTRTYDESFIALNDCTDLLFDPSERGYIDKMTTFPEWKIKDFIALYKSELSEYVEKNKLSKYLKGSDIKILENKSVGVYYNQEGNLHYQMDTLNEQLGKALKR